MGDERASGLESLAWSDPAGGILAYAVYEGALTEEHAAPIWASFETAEAAGRGIRLYAEIHALPRVGGGLILEKLKRLGTILSTLERMAIVGDKGWMSVYEKLVDPITKADIRHFSWDHRDDAIAWIRGDAV